MVWRTYQLVFSSSCYRELLVVRKNIVGRAHDNICLRHQRRVIFGIFEIISRALRILKYVLWNRQLLIIHDPAIWIQICAVPIRVGDSLNTIRIFCYGFSWISNYLKSRDYRAPIILICLSRNYHWPHRCWFTRFHGRKSGVPLTKHRVLWMCPCFCISFVTKFKVLQFGFLVVVRAWTYISTNLLIVFAFSSDEIGHRFVYDHRLHEPLLILIQLSRLLNESLAYVRCRLIIVCKVEIFIKVWPLVFFLRFHNWQFS